MNLQGASALPHRDPPSGPVFYPSPNVRRSAHELTPDEQTKIAKRIGLIHQLPVAEFDGVVNNPKFYAE